MRILRLELKKKNNFEIYYEASQSDILFKPVSFNIKITHITQVHSITFRLA